MTETVPYVYGKEFDKLYTAVRRKEGRLYSDEELLHLPDITSDHPFYTEWQVRKESCQRLKTWLERKLFPMKILEVGCGNGWLSHRLSFVTGASVTGIDINQMELRQAKRVFSHISNLRFLNEGIRTEKLDGEFFDHIIFAASIQYFPSLPGIIGLAMQRLKPSGIIHLLDTHFYKAGEIAAARQRTAAYFNELGVPEMTQFYFHHHLDDLRAFSCKTMYEPSFFQKQFRNSKNPFPWISIKKA